MGKGWSILARDAALALALDVDTSKGTALLRGLRVIFENHEKLRADLVDVPRLPHHAVNFALDSPRACSSRSSLFHNCFHRQRSQLPAIWSVGTRYRRESDWRLISREKVIR